MATPGGTFGPALEATIIAIHSPPVLVQGSILPPLAFVATHRSLETLGRTQREAIMFPRTLALSIATTNSPRVFESSTSH